MSFIQNNTNGKWRTAVDLDNAVVNMENNLQNMNKTFINKMLKALNALMITVQQKEAGIFNVALNWFRLYMKVYNTINPHDIKLLNHYENTVPTIITYIIGCLQYKTKEVPKYHYDLLVILEELLENVPDQVLNEITKFEIGTIGCLWNPIDLAGDFNTQSKALKILTILLKQFDGVRQNEELKCIKWTNLNLFQDKLKTIVQETQLTHVIENCTRELLNNYNMNLSKNIMVYSFYCSAAVLDNKYTFYKPLNLQKFWIDINYSPKTVSFKARFKLNPKTKYDDINVILKIEIMKLQNNMLLVYFKPAGDFSNYAHYLTNLTDNVIQFNLCQEELKRLKANNYVMDYFNHLNAKSNVKPLKTQKKDKNIFDLLKKEMSANFQDYKLKRSSPRNSLPKAKKTKYQSYIDSTPEKDTEPKLTSYLNNRQFENCNPDPVESPKTSRNKENETDKHPIRNLRNRKKFFTSILEDSDEEFVHKTANKRRSKSKKPRQTKLRCKQVCKVTPTVDLTKIDNMDTTKQNIEDIAAKKTPTLLTTQDCNKVLEQVANIYEIADNTYAKPCQSYRNFKLQSNPLTLTSNKKSNAIAKSRKKRLDKTDNESSAEKIRKVTNDCTLENKENINPQNHTIDSNIRPSAKTKSIISPHLFETQSSDKTTPIQNLTTTIECNQANFVENLQIDLTQDNNILICESKQNNGNSSSCDSIECEEVRGLNENSFKDLQYICTPTKSILYNGSEVNTPRPTSCMNISDLNDSDMEITQIVNNQNFLMERFNENNPGNSVTTQTTATDMNITYPTNNKSSLIVDQQTEKPSSSQTANKVIHENVNPPICLQEILNDFELNSDDNLYSNIETPNKSSYVNGLTKPPLNNNPIEHDYYKDCVIFQKRIDDAEISDSSEDDDQFTKLQKNSKKYNNQNFIIMQNQPLYLNQNLSPQNHVWTTPVKNDVISSNVTTTIATKCQVTPTAVIVQQIQVSAKKSIILRNKKSRTNLKANKSLNNYFQNMNSNQQLMESRKDKALQMRNSKHQSKFNHLIYHKDPNNRKLYHDQYYHHKPKAIEMKKHQEVNNPAHSPIALYQQLSKLTNRKQIFDCAEYANPYETPSTNPTTQTQYGRDDNFEQQSSPFNFNITENIEQDYYDNNEVNSSSGFLTTLLENPEISFKRDVLEILNDFNANFQLRLNNAQQMCLKNVSILYMEKFCEIAQNISKKSQEHNNELEEIRCNIGRLVRELERQYDKFVTKTKQFDVQKEIMKQVLDCISNTNTSNFINQQYEELKQQLSFEQNKVVENVWRKYMENHKK